MPETIAAVVVTFNRKLLLVECLDALLRQSRTPDRIYVVDQASTDGTEGFLLEQGLLNHPLVEYWRVPVNTGGAGGFHNGMKRAYQAGYSWIWVMDDDAIPDPEACERMIPLTQHDTVAAVSNHKLRRDRTTDYRHFVRIVDDGCGTPYIRLKYSSFVGLAVNRLAIDRIGLPKAELFFQYDDNEYCARLLSFGDIAYAPESVVVHKEGDVEMLRKHFFGRAYPRLSTDRYWRNYFSFRNNLWRLMHSPRPPEPWELLMYWRGLFRETLAVLLIDRDQTMNRLQLLSRAVIDAFRERFDNEWPFQVRTRMTGK